MITIKIELSVMIVHIGTFDLASLISFFGGGEINTFFLPKFLSGVTVRFVLYLKNMCEFLNYLQGLLSVNKSRSLWHGDRLNWRL